MGPDQVEMFGICLGLGAVHPPHSMARLQQLPQNNSMDGGTTKPQPSPLGMNLSELLNIQNRDCPRLGPSLRNSWPSPLPHLPQDTWQYKEKV